jgi:hypothetical protein
MPSSSSAKTTRATNTSVSFPLLVGDGPAPGERRLAVVIAGSVGEVEAW